MTKTLIVGGHKVLVDAADYDLVKDLPLSVHNGYVWTRHNKHYMGIHRLLLNPRTNELVDHINHDALDNRRSNLRICNKRQNMANSLKRSNTLHPYKGVAWQPKRGLWQAQIRHDGKMHNLGRFKTMRQAAMVYDLWAREMFGEFACTNFQPVASSLT